MKKIIDFITSTIIDTANDGKRFFNGLQAFHKREFYHEENFLIKFFYFSISFIMSMFIFLPINVVINILKK